MEVLILQVFVSLILVAGSVLLFAFTCRQRSFDHANRLALLPLESSEGPSKARGAITTNGGSERSPAREDK
jgi:hypothetical protein